MREFQKGIVSFFCWKQKDVFHNQSKKNLDKVFKDTLSKFTPSLKNIGVC